jgi:uncharacterized protein (TIGR03083 family)
MLPPEPAARGLASVELEDVAELVRTAWEGLIGLCTALDLEGPSRLPGWTVRDVLVHLGSWPEHTRFERLVEDVRQGRVSAQDDVDARNALVVAAHRDADAAEIAAALERARDRALAFLAGPDAERLGREPADSPIGPLPLTCVVAASAYELAIHALDVAPPEDVASGLLDAGVGALVDTTGALAARAGVRTAFVVLTPLGGWACEAADGGWSTMRLEPGTPVSGLGRPALLGEAADVIDASAGRRPALQLLLTRRLRMHDVAGLLTLLPALEAVPGLPGGVALRTAARALGQTGRLVGHLGSALRGD